MIADRTIVCPDFFSPGHHLYTDKLGWPASCKIEAKTSVSKKLFDYYIAEGGFNLVFYYVDDGHFYGIHTETNPIYVFRLAENPCEKTPYKRPDLNTHHWSKGDLIFAFYRLEDIWSGTTINGLTLEQVLQRSFIVQIL